MAQPDADRSELDRGEEVVVVLVVSCGDGAELLEFAEEALDDIAIPIEERAQDGFAHAIWHGLGRHYA